jgi:uncharacterized surface protein with fasciclin (FAS1) repeats
MLRKSLGSLALAGVLLGAIVPATFARSVVVPPSQATDSIVEIAAGAGAFTTLLAAVGCADPAVGAALTSGDQYTVFAPTDAAFGDAGLNAGNICTVPQGALTQILLYHVEEGRHFSNSVLPKRDGQMKTIGTLLGQSFWVDPTGAISTSSDGESQIVSANIAATNGVIHVVDAVLIRSCNHRGAAGPALPIRSRARTPVRARLHPTARAKVAFRS